MQTNVQNDLPLEEIIEILEMITSFEFFDQLAGTTRTPEEIVPIVQKLILKLLELDLK